MSTSEPSLIESAGLWGGRLWRFETLPSTNQWAIEHADLLQHGDVVQAVRQTAGRGRFTRHWTAPEDRGLTVTVVLDANRLAPDAINLLGPATALAVRDTLAEFTLIFPQVKWPNDVLASGRKIAGILAERHGTAAIIVIGIGLNVNLTPEDLQGIERRHPATSMRVETGREFDLHRVLTSLLRHVAATLLLATPARRHELWSQWHAHDALRDRQVRVETPSGVLEGACLGVADNGALRLRPRNGLEQLLYSGDVSVCCVDGCG